MNCGLQIFPVFSNQQNEGNQMELNVYLLLVSFYIDISATHLLHTTVNISGITLKFVMRLWSQTPACFIIRICKNCDDNNVFDLRNKALFCHQEKQNL